MSKEGIWKKKKKRRTWPGSGRNWEQKDKKEKEEQDKTIKRSMELSATAWVITGYRAESRRTSASNEARRSLMLMASMP